MIKYVKLWAVCITLVVGLSITGCAAKEPHHADYGFAGFKVLMRIVL